MSFVCIVKKQSNMARKKIREYDSKRLLKEHLKRLAGIDLQICSAQVIFFFHSHIIMLSICYRRIAMGISIMSCSFLNGVLIYASFFLCGCLLIGQFCFNLLFPASFCSSVLTTFLFSCVIPNVKLNYCVVVMMNALCL